MFLQPMNRSQPPPLSAKCELAHEGFKPTATESQGSISVYATVLVVGRLPTTAIRGCFSIFQHQWDMLTGPTKQYCDAKSSAHQPRHHHPQRAELTHGACSQLALCLVKLHLKPFRTSAPTCNTYTRTVLAQGHPHCNVPGLLEYRSHYKAVFAHMTTEGDMSFPHSSKYYTFLA